MENNGINIGEEQKKVREKIQAIEDSGIFGRVEKLLDAFGGKNIPSKNRALIGRIKKAESACEKIQRQGLPASEMYDLIGFMFIVDLPEEYLEAKSILHDGMPQGSYEHDFDGTLPENHGYTSFHMGVNKDRLDGAHEDTDPPILDGLSIEIQLKSMGMFIAQEATHDSIYKNATLSDEEKNQAQTVMFPLIERIVNAQKYQQALRFTTRAEQDKKTHYREMIAREEQEIERIKTDGRDFFDKKPELVEEIFCEYIVAQYDQMMKKEPFFGAEQIESKELKSYCRDAIQLLLPSMGSMDSIDGKPTGFAKIDNLYGIIMSSSVSQLREMSIRKKEQEAMPAILGNAVKVSEEIISSKDITEMSSTIVREQESKDKEVQERKSQDDDRNLG